MSSDVAGLEEFGGAADAAAVAADTLLGSA